MPQHDPGSLCLSLPTGLIWQQNAFTPAGAGLMAMGVAAARSIMLHKAERPPRRRPFCGVDETDQANDTLRRDWRNAKPRPAKPSSIMAQVAGSGMAATVDTVTLSRILPILLLPPDMSLKVSFPPVVVKFKVWSVYGAFAASVIDCVKLPSVITVVLDPSFRAFPARSKLRV